MGSQALAIVSTVDGVVFFVIEGGGSMNKPRIGVSIGRAGGKNMHDHLFVLKT